MKTGTIDDRVSIVNDINLYISPFSDTFGCFGKPWAFNEANRNTWYVKSLQSHISKCKEKNRK